MAGKLPSSLPSLIPCGSIKTSLLSLAILTLISITYISFKFLYFPLQNTSFVSDLSPSPPIFQVAATMTKKPDLEELSNIYHSSEVFRLNYAEMEENFMVYIYPNEDPNTFYQTPRNSEKSTPAKAISSRTFVKADFGPKIQILLTSSLSPFPCHKMRGKIIKKRALGNRSSTTQTSKALSLIPKFRFGSQFNQGLLLFNLDGQVLHRKFSKMEKGMSNNIQQPKNPIPSTAKTSFKSWIKWILGLILSILLPFWRAKWKQLLMLEAEVEIVAEMVENAAEAVAKVAAVTEKLSGEVADKSEGKIKEAALAVEHVAEEASRDAQLTEDIIHKVDELKQDVKTVIQPFIHNGKEDSQEHSSNQ